MSRQALAALIAAATVLGQSEVSAQSSSPVARSLDGVWRVTTTPRDCATGIERPQAAFEALSTFHGGGTMLGRFRTQGSRSFAVPATVSGPGGSR